MKYVFPIAVAMLMVSIGMSLDRRRIVDNWRKFGVADWIRLLLATFIIPPALALILARTLSLDLSDTAGLFMVGVVPGAPLMIRGIESKGFDTHLAASYQVWGAVLTPIIIPVTVYLGGLLYHRQILIEPSTLLLQIAKQQFLPLIAGMLIMAFLPDLGKKLYEGLSRAGNLILNVAIVALLVKMGPMLMKINPLLFVAALLLASGALAFGLWLTRGASERRATLAICNANRHIGLAMLMTGNYLHVKNAIPAIACYAIAAPIIMAIYAKKIYKRES